MSVEFTVNRSACFDVGSMLWDLAPSVTGFELVALLSALNVPPNLHEALLDRWSYEDEDAMTLTLNGFKMWFIGPVQLPAGFNPVVDEHKLLLAYAPVVD